ncbi:GNAT family N-acetyltransferase [Gulbenkiania mobilis]|uniref:GNAT family N-acetyltransferase n=1 Tax=Gulbenkiania mobilis TaxID=397457 RepID=UPI000B217B20|nr:GNAT family N-acetyltransferase [Gulbenkiania mobilis]
MTHPQIAFYEAKLAYETDPADVQAALAAGKKWLLVDARSTDAYARETIPSALSIPHRTMNPETTACLPRDHLIVTFCDGIGCNGSTQGALALARLGFNVKEMLGGIDWWKRDGYATTASPGRVSALACGCSGEGAETTEEAGLPLGEPVPGWKGARVPEPVVLQGVFCRLEPFDTDRHASSLRAALAEDQRAEGWTYLMDPPADEAAFAAWCAGMTASQDPVFYAIVDPQTREALGVASYLRIDPANGVIEVGWLHFSPKLQRTRAATEAMYLMMRQAFAWGYRRYEWKCNRLNAPSMVAARRLGFSYEGTFRQARVDRGRNRDTAWFSVLDGEWPKLSAAFEQWLAPGNFDEAGRQRVSLSSLTAAALPGR